MGAHDPDVGPARSLREAQRFDLVLKSALALTVTPENPVPELVALFGYEKAMEFILVFGGQTFKVPNAREIVKPLNVAGAAMSVFHKHATLQQAARKFGVPVVEVAKCIQVLQEEHRALVKARVDLEEATTDLQEEQDTIDY